MRRAFTRVGCVAALLAAALFAPCALAQEEFPPPQGKGRVVVMLSGASGSGGKYQTVAKAVAKLGYDVTLFDANKLNGKGSQALIAAIEKARSMPHALPGKVGLIGFSMGGGIALGRGSQLPSYVAVDIVWYPTTGWLRDPPGFASRIEVPVLMFAGTMDDYMQCCLISRARALADSAAAAKVPFELIDYPVMHDFMVEGTNYDPKAYADAFDRTAARLKVALADSAEAR